MSHHDIPENTDVIIAMAKEANRELAAAPPATPQTFGQLLRAERERAGKTMGELAGALGISVTAISDAERDLEPLSLPSIHRIAAALGSSPDTRARLFAAQLRQRRGRRIPADPPPIYDEVLWAGVRALAADGGDDMSGEPEPPPPAVTYEPAFCDGCDPPAAPPRQPLGHATVAGGYVTAHFAPSENPETHRAELDATLTDLAALVRIVRQAGGYLAPGDQVALRSAEARLVAHGRSGER
jgi:transcriptional regulator with XRE-family HTH domain